MIVGRLYTVVLVGVTVAWLPILQRLQGSQLWNYQQSIVSYLVPPIVAIFLLGICWKRATEPVCNITFSTFINCPKKGHKNNVLFICLRMAVNNILVSCIERNLNSNVQF